MAKAKRKGGRPAGTKEEKRRTNSPPVTLWEMEHGVGVPQTGVTVFASEARDELREFLGLLHKPNSWDGPEIMSFGPYSKPSTPMFAFLETDQRPWDCDVQGWLWKWLSLASIGRKGITFPHFCVCTPTHSFRLCVHVQAEEFALNVLRFGTHTLRALTEKTPQGFELAPKTFEPRPVFGQKALTGLAKMAEPPGPDPARKTLLETAIKLRRKTFDDTRNRCGADSFLAEREVVINFRELVREHTGEEIRSLEITDKSRLELLRRHAREFEKAGTINIRF